MISVSKTEPFVEAPGAVVRFADEEKRGPSVCLVTDVQQAPNELRPQALPAKVFNGEQFRKLVKIILLNGAPRRGLSPIAQDCCVPRRQRETR